MNNRLNLRIESTNKKKYEYELNHDLRVYNTPHIKNKNIFNRLHIPNKNLRKTKYQKIKGYDYRTEVFKKIDELTLKHKNLYKSKYKRNLRENNTNSINMGVLTFPREFTPEKFNMDLKTFIETGIKTIENICEKLDIELIYITCHLDEETPHFHFMTSNFDSKGNVIKRNANTGILLQDLTEIYFKEFGLIRGIPKEITGLNNVKKENQKIQKQNKDLKNKNNELQTEKEKLENEIKQLKNDKKDLETDINDLKQKQNKIWTDIKKLEEYIKEVKNDYIKYEDDVKVKSSVYKEIINPLIAETNRLSKMVKYNLDEINKTLNDENFIKRFKEIEKLKDKLTNTNNNDYIHKTLKELLEDTKPKPLNIKKPDYDYSTPSFY